jgi:DNA-binding LytR/AlgR family response regulator
MKTLNCLIVDDEELARMLLENFVSRLPHLNLVGKCANPFEAMQVLQEHTVDLIFLDIQMPEMTGTEFLKTLTQKPLVIFTTAYSEYAIEGYELDVVDYLLKPFSFERFMQAVNKASQRLKLETAVENQNSKSENTNENEHILVKSEHKVYRILWKDILYIQSMREYVAYYTTTEKRILSLGSLKGLEEELPDSQFMRVHKSYIISKNKVKALEGNMVHIGEEKIPIGASYMEAVLSHLF